MSPNSDEDEWGGHSSNNHYAIGPISYCPMVMVHAGKRFKTLIDFGAALTLAPTTVYNMIEDCYETKILPAAVHLKTADGSSMSSLGKATLHLCIANFNFSHTFVICDKLPDTDILFGTDIQRRNSQRPFRDFSCPMSELSSNTCLIWCHYIIQNTQHNGP